MRDDSAHSAALLGGAFIDQQLEYEIRTKFLALPTSASEALFQAEGGALSATSAKIHLAYCLGLFGEITKRDLEQIIKIRNLFAHSNFAITFQTGTVRNMCLSLKAIFEYENLGIARINLTDEGKKDPRELYVASCLEIGFAMVFERNRRIEPQTGTVVFDFSLDLRPPCLP